MIIANNNMNGHKTSTARPLTIIPGTLRICFGLSTHIVTAFLEIYIFKYCHRPPQNRIAFKTVEES